MTLDLPDDVAVVAAGARSLVTRAIHEMDLPSGVHMGVALSHRAADGTFTSQGGR